MSRDPYQEDWAWTANGAAAAVGSCLLMIVSPETVPAPRVSQEVEPFRVPPSSPLPNEENEP